MDHWVSDMYHFMDLWVKIGLWGLHYHPSDPFSFLVFFQWSQFLVWKFYFLTILVVNCIEDCFDQPGYRIYKTLELLLVKACKEEDFEDDLQIVCSFYRDDFIVDNLRAQLKTFGLHFKQNFKHPIGGRRSLTIFDVKEIFLSFSSGQMLLLSQVKRLLQFSSCHASHQCFIWVIF